MELKKALITGSSQLQICRLAWEGRLNEDTKDQVVKDLFATSFVKEELGLEFEMGSSAMHALAEYFLGIYALDRLYAKEDGEKYSEDLFYAGGHLKQSFV